jgi:hypothetical protein
VPTTEHSVGEGTREGKMSWLIRMMKLLFFCLLSLDFPSQPDLFFPSIISCFSLPFSAV